MFHRLKRALLLAIWGAAGASVAGLLVYGLLAPMAAGSVRSLRTWMLAQGASFVPLGVSIGISIAQSGRRSYEHKAGLMVGIGIGGVLYGALSFFSLGGGILGLALLSTSVVVSVGIALRSIRRALVLAGCHAAMNTGLVLALRLGDAAFVMAFILLDPLRAMIALGASGIIVSVAWFYSFTLLTLVGMWGDLEL